MYTMIVYLHIFCLCVISWLSILTSDTDILLSFLINSRQQYIPYNPRGGDFRRGRGGFHQSSRTGDGNDTNPQNQPTRVPPPTYVCYRCGQKGKEPLN